MNDNGSYPRDGAGLHGLMRVSKFLAFRADATDRLLVTQSKDAGVNDNA